MYTTNYQFGMLHQQIEIFILAFASSTAIAAQCVSCTCQRKWWQHFFIHHFAFV